MIKTFEEFDSFILKKSDKISNEDLVQMLSTIALIWNHGDMNTPMYGKFEKMCRFLSGAPWNFIDTSDFFDWSDDYNWNNLTGDDRRVIVDLYKRIVNEFSLYDFPKMDDLDEVFIPIKDLTEIELTLNLDEKKITIEVNTIPSVKTFMNANKIKVNFEEWDSIVQEISPAINRILDLGYSCDFYLRSHGKVELVISI